MKNVFKRVAASTVALSLIASIGAVGAFAAAPAEKGSYTGSIRVYKENTTEFVDRNLSMCDPLFDHDVDVTLTDDGAQLDVYVANPVPMFPSKSQDGTLKDMTLTIGETRYTGTSDVESKEMRTFDTWSFMFGMSTGKEYQTQKVTFTLPRDAMDALEQGVASSAHVNAMNMTQKFVVQVKDLKPVGAPTPEATTPEATETSEKSMNVTADIKAPEATYTVTIPESVSMGTLSAEQDNVLSYQVDVTAANMGDGYVEVSAPADGVLTSGENQLAFQNSFGAQKATADATLDGAFTVSAEAVKAAAAGNYTGTANFTIRYFAGK